MASAGYWTGLGGGMQGMAQGLSQFVSLKEAQKDRDLRKAERGEDLKFRRDRAMTEDEHWAAQQKRQDTQDERQLVEKVLGNIAKPKTKIDSKIASAAERQGFGSFVHKSTPQPIMGPGGTFIGGVDLGPTADPMISPAIQAQMDAIANKADYNNSSLELKAQIAAAQQAARLAQISQAQAALQATIDRGNADRDQRDRTVRAQLEARIRHEVTNEALAANPMAAYDQAEREKLTMAIEAEVQKRVGASFPGNGGITTGPSPSIDMGPGGSGFDGLPKGNPLPWDPNVIPGAKPAPQGAQGPTTIFDLPAPDVRGTLNSAFNMFRNGGRRFMGAIDAVPNAQENRRKLLQGQ